LDEWLILGMGAENIPHEPKTFTIFQQNVEKRQEIMEHSQVSLLLISEQCLMLSSLYGDFRNCNFLKASEINMSCNRLAQYNH
jgi:hypothetical protein